MPIISALKRLRQENLEFQASLGFILRCCLKKKERSQAQWLTSAILTTGTGDGEA
jgi:hypothetical protein